MVLQTTNLVRKQIDMIDPDRFVFPERPGPLAPEDEVLLNAEREFAKGKKAQGSVPWLRPSEIITANFDENMYVLDFVYVWARFTIKW